MMNVAIAQLNFHIGNFELNTEKIIQAIEEAKAQNADLVVFPELAVCGYPPLDFLEFERFIEQCEESVNRIIQYTDNIAVVLGAPSRNHNNSGKSLYNSAYVIENKKVSSIHHKALLPNYDVFDEYRYFESADDFCLSEIKGKKWAVTVCEDIWDVGEEKMYKKNPLDYLQHLGFEGIINIAASPFSYAQIERREKILKENAKKYQVPIVYVNHVGAQTELIFDGGSSVLNDQSEKIASLDYFKEQVLVCDISEQHKTSSFEKIEKYKLIEEALVHGIKNYFSKMNFSKAVIGLSGGIDSALVLYLAVKALGNEHVLSVLLPSQYSSNHSVDDAIQLCKNLDSKYEIIPIQPIYESFMDALRNNFKDKPFNIAEENIQSRSRGVILMGISNKWGNILLNTSNKSELAVGYGTLYGDMCGGLSVIGDLYKTEVYGLCEFINREQEIIPVNILEKAPSAELRPNQKDSDSLPDYPILDAILQAYIEGKKTPNQIIESGFDEALVRKVLHLVNISEYKRKQFAPILRVSDKAFGLGRRLPIVGKYWQ